MSDQSEIPVQLLDAQAAVSLPAQPGKRLNKAANAGLVLALLFWPLGLVFSAIGLARAKALSGAGRTVAVIGLALSVVFCGVTVAVVSLSGKNPGACASATAGSAAFMPTLTADEQKLNTDEADELVPWTPPRADLQAFTADLQSAKSSMDRAVSEETDSTAQGLIQTVDDMLGSLIDEIPTVQDGGGLMQLLGKASGSLPLYVTSMNQYCAGAGE
jgi:hypothetical protein